MKKNYYLKFRFLFLFLSVMFLFILTSFNNTSDNSFSRTFKDYFSSHSSRLLNNILLLFKETDKKNFNPNTAKLLLSNVRIEYKAIEPFVITFFPGDARLLNRPIITEMEEDDEISSYVVPHGFQYIEKILYNDSVLFYRKKVREEVENIYCG